MKPEFHEPADFKWGHFDNEKGAAIRYGHLPAEGGSAKGTVVILGGFRECIEKYFEVAREQSAEGYDVWLMDWRGQGGSERYVAANPQLAHHQGYDEQIATLGAFVDTIVEKPEKGPMMLMAHSMGAHISLRFLQEHPGVFDSAILSAPMIDIVTGNLPKPLARQMAKFAKAGNYLEKYVPGGMGWNPDKEKFEGNIKTSDPDRFAVQNELYAANENLRIGDATYGWVYHTFQSIDVLNQEDYLKSIQTPILMQISSDEKVVVKGAQERAAGLLPDCRKVEIAGARHEIWMERDELRNQWKSSVKSFMQERVEASLQPKKSGPHSAPKPPAAG